MSEVRYRRRGTAIVETAHGILLTAGRPGKPFILPGGGARRGESRFMAALRKLTYYHMRQKSFSGIKARLDLRCRADTNFRTSTRWF
jgi:hypothetical protein